MIARIYRPARTAMQSGKGKAKHWVLKYEAEGRKGTDPLMGYTATSDTLSQVSMRFETREDAVDYAERNDIAYRVQEPKEARRSAVSYSDNFKYDRKVPWTH
ncbi:ETC complex I subunit [Ahrensia sp. R2A130]|uniref:ETC complex I subunit n=1 Tax=Ahrensia sp. R2A130 TaxID=744979 RepID=UPI0001E08BE4|nr:ETC complex I subunit [Ahrensia sp. R2A130]EFL89940.1 ETC complex I subunit region [Ahrensia sp. R2A130]